MGAVTTTVGSPAMKQSNKVRKQACCAVSLPICAHGCPWTASCWRFYSNSPHVQGNTKISNQRYRFVRREGTGGCAVWSTADPVVTKTATALLHAADGQLPFGDPTPVATTLDFGSSSSVTIFRPGPHQVALSFNVRLAHGRQLLAEAVLPERVWMDQQQPIPNPCIYLP